ncbi:unnamed protein product [Orchesella dallaii]|uniref:Odorant receptor n=1 Tax=Orchesella dallaii TaxID=48710 RepID=A0ABP1PL95_9HEXA
MLRTLGFLSPLSNGYKRAVKIPGCSYQWDKKHQRIFVKKEKKILYWFSFLIFVAAINAHAAIVYKKHGEIVQMSLCIVGITAMLINAFGMWLNYKNPRICSKFLNSLLEIEDQLYSEGQQNSITPGYLKLELAMCNLFLLAAKLSPLLLGFCTGFLPCSAPNFVAPLNPLCDAKTDEWNGLENGWKFLKIGEFLVVAFLNGIIWKATVAGGCFICIHIMVGFSSQIILVKRIRSEVSFDLSLYTKVRLVNIYFNQFHCGFLFLLMAVVSSEQACTMYTSFQAVAQHSGKMVPIPVGIWSGGLCLVLIATNLIMYGVAGSLHTVAMDTLRVAKERKPWKNGIRNAEWKRMLKACPPIKIAFGMSNFIGKETTLNFFHYSIERFIDLLLLNRV